MGIKAGFPDKLSATNVTLQLLDITMLLVMVSEMALRGEGAAAPLELTSEGLLAGVNSHMRLQVPIFSKCLIANFALKRFFPGMCSLVNLESPRP